MKKNYTLVFIIWIVSLFLDTVKTSWAFFANKPKASDSLRIFYARASLFYTIDKSRSAGESRLYIIIVAKT